MLSIVYFIIGGVFIIYDIILLVTAPGTFLDNITAFTHIWLILGLILIFLGIYRIKKGHSIWHDLNNGFKITILTFLGIGIVITITCLCFIFNPKVVSEDENADYVILLGGGIDKNGRLPQNVMNKIYVTADYMKCHEDVKCIVTGGTLKWLPYAEAPAMKSWLVNLGIDQEKIIIEDQAKDTIQNLQFSCKLLAEREGKTIEEILNSKILIITNYFHLNRAEFLAERMGYRNVTGLGASCGPLAAVHLYIREICAYVKLFMRIQISGEPSGIL